MPNQRQRPIFNETRQRAKQLRRAATVPEKLLWSVLRGRQLAGFKFRRQHPIEPYVADFYCTVASLIVELDGESHNEREDYDRRRESNLRERGMHIFRVTNDDVMNNLEGVAEGILRELMRLRGGRCPSPNPSPWGRGTG